MMDRKIDRYGQSLNNVRVKGANRRTVKNLWVNLDCPTLKLSLGICGGLFPGPPWTPKSAYTQVPYIKWHNACSQPSTSEESKTVQVFSERNGHISAPMQFKPVLFNCTSQISPKNSSIFGEWDSKMNISP